MVFGVIDFLKKTKQIQLYYYDTSGRLVFVHFLEEIEDTKKSFRNYLTFRSQVQSIKFEDKVLLCWLVLRPQMVGVPAPLAF